MKESATLQSKVSLHIIFTHHRSDRNKNNKNIPYDYEATKQSEAYSLQI